MVCLRVGVVGSRRFSCRASVSALVSALPSGSVVVSGGCRGVDSWAVASARARGLAVREFLPDLAGASGLSYHQICERYYARNRLIAESCDVLVAFVSSDRRGGTENTIRHATALGVPVVVVLPSANSVLLWAEWAMMAKQKKETLPLLRAGRK